MEKVNVSRGVLGALVGVAATSLLAVAFLLGRASRPESAPAPAPTPAALPAPAEVAPGTSAPEPSSGAREEEAGTAPAPAEARDPASPAGTPRPEPARTAASPGERDPDRAAVVSYLEAVSAIRAGEAGGPAESAANEMASALVRGDASGLDRIIRETEESQRELLAITPPAACRAHYAETRETLDESIEMLRALRQAALSAEPGPALADVARRAEALRLRAEALKREDEALRRRWGVPP